MERAAEAGVVAREEEEEAATGLRVWERVVEAGRGGRPVAGAEAEAEVDASSRSTESLSDVSTRATRARVVSAA
jgi:hypothetical protein